MTSVLVVEDDVTFRSSLARDLKRRGFDVRVASTAEEATEILGDTNFDVILTDLRLGGRDGVDLLDRARKLAPATKAVLMSGFATARDYQRATELGAVGVLCKPFTSAELSKAIENALAHRKSEGAVAWLDGAVLVRLQDAGAPMVVIDSSDRIVEATLPARTLLAKFSISCEPGDMLPAPLIAELREALLGEAIMWRPAGDDGLILGSTRYRLGERHHFLLLREITQQQRAMAQRLHQRRLLETGKLVAHIAHEMRTPLASIVYNADILGQRDLGTSTELVQEIQLAAENLRRTIAGLLDYVRLGPPVATTVTLRELWDRVASLLRPMFRAGHHELSIQLHDADLRVSANPMTLEQIFVNLLVNAMEASTRPAKIEITTEPVPSSRARQWRARDVVLVSVQDDGPGIPFERRETVFDAFVTSKPNGTGLGLTLAREAATSIGGYLRVENCPAGCRFGVVLPVASEEAS